MSLVPFRKPHTSRMMSSGFEDFDRIFDNFFKNALSNMSVATPEMGDLPVRLNVSETGKAYRVRAELPGMEEGDVKLTLSDGILTLSGEKSQESEEEGETFHRVESSYGSFTRSLQLPSDADEDSVTATMKKGVLTIEIGKHKEESKNVKNIQIKS